MRTMKLRYLLTALCFLACASDLRASMIGTDNAAQTVYDNGWQTGDDGSASGDAFLSWTLATSTTDPGYAGHFIGNSTNLTDSGTGANINSSSESFGLYGGNGGSGSGQSDAFRSFNGGGLSVGQTFSIDLAVNFRNGYKGIDIRNVGNDAVLFNLNVNNPGGGDDYTVFSSSFAGSLGNTYNSNIAFRIALTQISATDGNWSVTRSGGVLDVDSGSYTGAPASIKLYVGQTENGNENDFFANNLSIVPEPTPLLLLYMGSLACVRSRRRRVL